MVLQAGRRSGKFRQALQYLLGQALLLGFSVTNTWFPQHFFYFIIGYFIVIMGIMAFQSRKAISKIKTAKEAVSKGRRLYKAKLTEVNQLMMKDAKLKEDLKAQFSILMFMFLPILIIFMVFGPLKDLILGSNPEPGALQTFIGYVILYESLFVISYSTRIASLINVKRKGFSMLQVPSEYIVTEKGIVGGNFAVEFPVKAKRFSYNEERSFVEFDMASVQASMGGVTRVRLYTKKPRELYELLREKVVVESG